MKLKIGVLGASRGMDYALKITNGSNYAEVYAICETYEPLRIKAGEMLRQNGRLVYCFSRYEDMLDSGIDAVIICNYANEHAPYAIQALERGIHVMSEVQPVQTPAEGAALCEAVEKSGCVYAYAENYCYLTGNLAMKRHYEAGDIGKAVCLEGDFINDCSSRWHLLTRGIRNHWRNYVPSTFYCTHSIGPLFYSTGLRGIRVNGFEIPRMDYMAQVGARSGSAAMEIMELNNGGIAKSMNGNYRSSFRCDYRLIGEKGSLESDGSSVTIYTADKGTFSDSEILPYRFSSKTGTDSFANADYDQFGFFVGSILGDEESKKQSIDVYSALDMALPGLFAFRSILSRGQSFDVPDFRDKTVRASYADDHYCTDPSCDEKYRLPTSKNGTPEVDEVVYEAVRATFNSIDLTPGGK